MTAMGSAQVTHGAHSEPNWVPIDPTRFAFTPRRLRVVCIGAGFSGLTIAYKLKYEKEFKNFVDLTIYDKNDGVGGTWRQHNYPGLFCDVPSHVYSFPFEPNPNWSQFYSSGREILSYIENTAKKYKLDECVQLNSRVIESIWNDHSGKWKIKIDQRGTIIDDEADIFIAGAGFLNKWTMPNIDGIDDFKGKLVHSAGWDTTYDHAGKRIAVIGNGSSGIQLVAALQKSAGKLVNYLRNPTWISFNVGGQFTPTGSNFPYSDDQLKEFRESPEKFLAYRKQVESAINNVYAAMLKDSPLNVMFQNMCTGLMKARLGGSDELASKFIPNYNLGCRRLTPGDGYLEALQQENARATFSPIKRITENGIETEEGEEEFDLIVCATGYDVDFLPSWKVIGRNGVDLREVWSKGAPQAYFSTCAADMPNFFLFHGPNTPIGHGSLTAAIGWLADYVLQWIEKIATEGIKSITVKNDVVDDFNVYVHEQLKRTVWAGDCPAWYKSKSDPTKVVVMYAGSVLHFKASVEKVRGEDFYIEYISRNRFSYLGNGEMALEKAEDADLAYYLS